MLVVFVTHNYPRHAGDLPGAFLHSLATALLARGHDVRVVAPSDHGRGGREPLDAVPVRRVRYARPERETLAYTGRMQEAIRSPSGLLALRALIRALRQGAQAELAGAAGNAVLHAHWWIPGGMALPPGRPSITTVHGTDVRLLERSLVGRWLGRRTLRAARVVTAVSSDLAQAVERATGRNDVHTHVQPMPVDSAGRPWSRGGGGAIVVARLTAQKRVDLAIQTVAQLQGTGKSMRLTIVGEGPERADLERQAAATLPPGSVRFMGLVSAVAVADLLATADVMLFPAAAEGFGLAAVEALMAGVPVVVCRDGGGVLTAVQAHGGGVVTDPVAAAIAAGVGTATSPPLREEARRAGERWRQELAPARVAERYEGWYREALGA